MPGMNSYEHSQYVCDRLAREVENEQLAGYDRAAAIVRVAERYAIDPFKVRDVIRGH
jgi:hypothetical protein